MKNLTLKLRSLAGVGPPPKDDAQRKKQERALRIERFNNAVIQLLERKIKLEVDKSIASSSLLGGRLAELWGNPLDFVEFADKIANDPAVAEEFGINMTIKVLGELDRLSNIQLLKLAKRQGGMHAILHRIPESTAKFFARETGYPCDAWNRNVLR